MNKFGVILAVAGLFSAFSADASVSGYHDSGRQIKAILDSKTVGNGLSQHPIVKIEQTDDLRFNVSSKDCTLNVALIAIAPPDGMIGSPSYEVEGLVTKHCSKN
jgi:hypothetical protein